MSVIRLIHLADIHLGFTGPANLVLGETENEKAAGRYLREVDIEEAVRKMTIAIIRAQPPIDVVVIAGDFFHRPAPYPRAISLAARMIQTLSKSDIAVVIIDGNHETANVLHIGSPTTFLRELGAYVVNGTEYQILHDQWNYTSPEKQARTTQLAIHALPYQALRGEPKFTDVHPLPGYINVLLTHGRVSGLKDLNSLHHTAYTIPSEILRRGWDYVALGDWHIHGYQPLKDIPAFYSGSLEALNFGEARKYPLDDSDVYAVHGALDIRLKLGKQAEVQTFANQEARPVLYLDTIDAMHADADSLMDMLRTRLHPQLPSHALALLEVENVLPQVREQLDHAEIEQRRKFVRRCDIRWTFQRISPSQSDEVLSEATLDRQWEHFLEQREQDTMERIWHRDEGIKRIDEARYMLQAIYAQKGE